MPNLTIWGDFLFHRNFAHLALHILHCSLPVLRSFNSAVEQWVRRWWKGKCRRRRRGGYTCCSLLCSSSSSSSSSTRGRRLGPGDRGSCFGSRLVRGHWLTIDGVLGILYRSWFSEFWISEVWIWMISSGEWIWSTYLGQKEILVGTLH